MSREWFPVFSSWYPLRKKKGNFLFCLNLNLICYFSNFKNVEIPIKSFDFFVELPWPITRSPPYFTPSSFSLYLRFLLIVNRYVTVTLRSPHYDFLTNHKTEVNYHDSKVSDNTTGTKGFNTQKYLCKNFGVQLGPLVVPLCRRVLLLILSTSL